MSECLDGAFLVPDGCGGWKRPNEEPKRYAYSNGCSAEDSALPEHQRYRRLASIAREMFGELTTEHLSLDDIAEYRKALKELGVDVDG